jgi:hypothetical protein
LYETSNEENGALDQALRDLVENTKVLITQAITEETQARGLKETDV